MTILAILQYPNPRLRTIGKTVTNFDAALHKIIDDMFETHYSQENCAALAATQLDIMHPPRITVIDFSSEKNQPLCLINPELSDFEGELIQEEGCMSVGGNTYEKVKRATKVKVRAQDKNGKPFEFTAEGFMAKCVQHEIDHLNGKLFIDYLSLLKRERIEQRLKKISRQQKNVHKE